MDEARMRDKFRGALLGTFAGDAVGAPVEGWDEARLNRAAETYSALAEDTKHTIGTAAVTLTSVVR